MIAHRRTSLLGLAACLLGGCTVVRIEGPASVTLLRPGVLTIAPAPGAAMTAYRVDGVGLVPGRGGATLGWSHEVAVIVADPARCQLVLFDPPADNAVWRQVLRDHTDICIRGKTP